MANQTLPTNDWPANAVPSDLIPPGRKRLGWALMAAATLGLLATILVQILYKSEVDTIGFETWRPVVYAYVLWGVAIGIGQVLTRGEDGQRALFLLPALLFTIAMVIFPTLFGFYIALTDWNLSSFSGRRFNGLDNFWQMLGDPYYRNALFNMVLYVLAVLVEYVIAFGLALLLNAQIRARKFFRVVFLMPLMLSPVEVSWTAGQVADGISLRAGGDTGAPSRLGKPGLLLGSDHRPHLDHGAGCLDLHPVHDDHAARRLRLLDCPRANAAGLRVPDGAAFHAVRPGQVLLPAAASWASAN